MDLADVHLVEDALESLANLTVAYENRLFFKQREAAQAITAARKVGAAREVLRRERDALRAAQFSGANQKDNLAG